MFHKFFSVNRLLCRSLLYFHLSSGQFRIAKCGYGVYDDYEDIFIIRRMCLSEQIKLLEYD